MEDFFMVSKIKKESDGKKQKLRIHAQNPKIHGTIFFFRIVI